MLLLRSTIVLTFLFAGVSAGTGVKPNTTELAYVVTTPSDHPSSIPSDVPSDAPSDMPSSLTGMVTAHSDFPSSMPSDVPSDAPSDAPSDSPVDTGGQFDIYLDIPLVAEVDQGAFLGAEMRWEEVVIGDLGDWPTEDLLPDFLSEGCAYPEIIDDLYICGAVEPVDGRSGILGFAGPVNIRIRNDDSFAGTITGRMVFDEADVPFLRADGTYESVVLHEMGHVFGFGTLWELFGITDPDPNCLYFGTNANAEWKTLTGCPQIPTELDFDQGNRCFHWDEGCLGNELMTGFAESAGVEMPLSRLTIAALADLGYEVNYDVADDFGVADLNTDVCPLCNRRGLRDHSTMSFTRELTDKKGGKKTGKNGGAKRKLSSEMEAKAVAYGKSILEACALDGEMPVGLQYVGDKVVSVLVEENRMIYDVLVTAF